MILKWLKRIFFKADFISESRTNPLLLKEASVRIKDEVAREKREQERLKELERQRVAEREQKLAVERERKKATKNPPPLKRDYYVATNNNIHFYTPFPGEGSAYEKLLKESSSTITRYSISTTPISGKTYITFSRRLVEYVQEKCGNKASVCYKRAGVSRQVYSNIISGKCENVSKRTAFQLCIGLRLTYPEAENFMLLAGYAFSPVIYEDMVFAWFLKNSKYDLYDINDVLAEGNVPPLTIY